MGHLAIVDAGELAYRYFFGAGNAIDAIRGVCERLDRLRAEPIEFVAVAADHPGNTFRNDIFPAYKSHRPPKPDGLPQFIATVKDAVRAFGLPLLKWDAHEADDVIASATRVATAAGASVSIMSSDKDLCQLVQPGVTILARHGSQTTRLDAAAVEAKHGVRPQQIPDLLAICGDASDNIPGVDGIGPRKAAELLRTFGSVEALLAVPRHAIHAIPRIRKIAEAVHDASEAVRTYLRLTTLDAGLPLTLDALRPAPLDRWALATFLEPRHPDLLAVIRERGRR